MWSTFIVPLIVTVIGAALYDWFKSRNAAARASSEKVIARIAGSEVKPFIVHIALNVVGIMVGLTGMLFVGLSSSTPDPHETKVWNTVIGLTRLTPSEIIYWVRFVGTVIFAAGTFHFLGRLGAIASAVLGNKTPSDTLP